MRAILKPVAVVASAILAIVIGYGTAGATNNKVTLCHNGHTITVSEHALKGHFDHDGQPARGHETDYLGACVATPPTTTPPTTVPTPPTTEPPVVEPPVIVPPAEGIPPVVITKAAPAAAPAPAEPAVTG